MSLLILKASAGSGKTYSLTEAFVRTCLNKENHLDFSNTMAITFTNKATAEMKDRIIGLLYLLSKNPEKYSGIGCLETDLEMSREKIKEESRNLLYRILTGFDMFSVTTIDSFFTRLYGSMALDLFGEAPRDITLDTDLALYHAAETLTENAAENAALQKTLLDLLEENIKNGKGLGLNYSLTKLGRELFNDQYLILRKNKNNPLPERDFHTALTQSLEVIDAGFDSYKDRLRALLASVNMTGEDFYMKFINSILNRDNVSDLLELKSFTRLPNPGEWFTKGKAAEMEVRVAPVAKELQILGEEFYDFCRENHRRYSDYSVVLDNYASYRILRYLDEALSEYFETERIIPLSEVNMKISKHLSDHDAMIVYERIGQYVHSVMIDEFQDTSLIQWNNLKPLIGNNLAQGYPNLVVGDVKQAIYRFRNGNWEIMELEVPEFQKLYQSNGSIGIKELDTNWRSRPEIINFNNNLFDQMTSSLKSSLSGYLQDLGSEYDWPMSTDPDFANIRALAEAPETIYRKQSQKVSSAQAGKTGYVEAVYRVFGADINDVEIEEERFVWLKKTILDLQGDGYQGGDIGILARGKKELGMLAEKFSAWADENEVFRFSSEDSLKLSLSTGLQLLIAALRLKIGQNPEINKMVFRNYLLKLDKKAGPAGWSGTEIPEAREDEIPESEGSISQLYLFFESVIHKLRLSDYPGEYPFILTFLEEVKKFEEKNGADTALFLDYWDRKIQHQNIKMSDDASKIRLFTIHKSKGLEFEVVILPFARWDLEISNAGNILWEAVETDELLKFGGPLPVRYSSSLLHSSFYKVMISEYFRNVVDNLNLLYVALTRPKDRLYLWLHEKSKKSSRKKTVEDKPVTDTLDFFRAGMKVSLEAEDQVITEGEKTAKARGEIPEKEDLNFHLEKLSFRSRPLPLQLKPRFDGMENESVGRGLIIHRMLENVKTRQDISLAVKKSVQEGDISEKESKFWTAELERILNFEPARLFFDPGWKIYNEKSIMIPTGGEYRPDRIQENEHEFIVIDYKTGEPMPAHKTQIENYRKLIASIVRRPVRSFIYYISVPDWVEVH